VGKRKKEGKGREVRGGRKGGRKGAGKERRREVRGEGGREKWTLPGPSRKLVFLVKHRMIGTGHGGMLSDLEKGEAEVV